MFWWYVTCHDGWTYIVIRNFNYIDIKINLYFTKVHSHLLAMLCAITASASVFDGTWHLMMVKFFFTKVNFVFHQGTLTSTKLCCVRHGTWRVMTLDLSLSDISCSKNKHHIASKLGVILKWGGRRWGEHFGRSTAHVARLPELQEQQHHRGSQSI